MARAHARGDAPLAFPRQNAGEISSPPASCLRGCRFPFRPPPSPYRKYRTSRSPASSNAAAEKNRRLATGHDPALYVQALSASPRRAVDDLPVDRRASKNQPSTGVSDTADVAETTVPDLGVRTPRSPPDRRPDGPLPDGADTSSCDDPDELAIAPRPRAPIHRVDPALHACP